MGAGRRKRRREDMGNGWREWIVGLCEMCAAGALCDLLCGEGPSRRAVRWIVGLSLMNAFLEAAGELARWAAGM